MPPSNSGKNQGLPASFQEAIHRTVEEQESKGYTHLGCEGTKTVQSLLFKVPGEGIEIVNVSNPQKGLRER